MEFVGRTEHGASRSQSPKQVSSRGSRASFPSLPQEQRPPGLQKGIPLASPAELPPPPTTRFTPGFSS